VKTARAATAGDTPLGPRLFVPLVSGRRANEVAAQIREAIFTGGLRTGDRLPPERELARTFHVSPIVAREAVHMLETAGLVSIRRGSTGGAFVAEVTHRPVAESLATLLRLGGATLHQVSEARLVIEPEIAAFAAARRRPEHLALLEHNLDETDASLASTRTARRLNLQFHKLLVGITGNPFLAVCLGALIENLENNAAYMDLALDAVASTRDQHREIYRAVRRRDAAAAAQRMHRHVLHMQRELERCARAAPPTSPDTTE